MFELIVKKYRGRFAVFAGDSRLSALFKNEDDAKNELNDNYELYKYWSNSAGVSLQNTPAIVKTI